jgi:mannosyltransferase
MRPEMKSMDLRRTIARPRPESGEGAEAPIGAIPPSRDRLFVWITLGVVITVAIGLVLRFWTTSQLWLDEALTVNVAGLPLHRLPDALRHDGAPPLYYVLLHFWMLAFGTGNLAVRSLSGVISVVSLPLAWLAGRRLGGRSVAWVTLLLVASSPFAIRYATENRMYSLVVLLTLLGYLALTSVMRRPRPANLIGLAIVTGLLLYAHYWSIYLVVVVAAYLVWISFRGSSNARWALLAVAAGCLTFAPWLPIFVFQARHTGTPWAVPASFSAMVHAVSGFAGGDTTFADKGDTSPARALGLVFFALAGLGLFGAALSRRRIELDLFTRPRARAITFVTVGTLALAVVAGYLTSSAFQDRYTAVVFTTFILLVALGTTTFADRWVRYGVVGLAVVLGLSTSASNVTFPRTQAGQVAAAIQASAHPGDVVGYCPDQLGPAVSRLLPTDLNQLTFPSGGSPRFVDWVDYAARNEAGNPAAFASALLARAGPAHTVWLVWAPNYLTLDGKCQAILSDLVASRPSSSVVSYDSQKYYEFSDLVRFPPR